MALTIIRLIILMRELRKLNKYSGSGRKVKMYGKITQKFYPSMLKLGSNFHIEFDEIRVNLSPKYLSLI
jgi:hypothetical protein